jgi:hypothetical protein
MELSTKKKEIFVDNSHIHTRQVMTVKVLLTRLASSAVGASNICGLLIVSPTPESQLPIFDSPSGVNSRMSKTKSLRKPSVSKWTTPVSPVTVF